MKHLVNKSPKLIPNIFLYGMSGSGKDTVANIIKSGYDYQIIRLAHTIKSVICEKNGITFDEIEERKRDEKWLRDEHHKISDMLGGQQATINRITQILNKTSMDFHLANPAQNVCVCDCRTYTEATMFLNAGWFGIFLTRTTDEYKNTSHFTEANIINNGQLEIILGMYNRNQIIVIDNNDKQLDVEISDNSKHITNGTVKMLTNVITNKIIPTIKEIIK